MRQWLQEGKFFFFIYWQNSLWCLWCMCLGSVLSLGLLCEKLEGRRPLILAIAVEGRFVSLASNSSSAGRWWSRTFFFIFSMHRWFCILPFLSIKSTIPALIVAPCDLKPIHTFYQLCTASPFFTSLISWRSEEGPAVQGYTKNNINLKMRWHVYGKVSNILSWQEWLKCVLITEKDERRERDTADVTGVNKSSPPWPRRTTRCFCTSLQHFPLHCIPTPLLRLCPALQDMRWCRYVSVKRGVSFSELADGSL